MITWLSTKSPLRMLDAPIDRATEEHLRENCGVDIALLAVDLRLSPAHVRSKQRRLGLRELAPTGKRRGLR